MKKFCILFFVALVTVASCSKTIIPESSEQNDWVNDVSLPVPIEFGGGSITKGAPINTINDLNGKVFGVFAADKSADAWSADDETIYLNNEQAYSDSEGKVYFGTSASNRKTYYYPLLSNSNLTFYAYYTHRNTNNSAVEAVPVVTNNQITAIVYLGGGSTADILWAKAEATPVTYTPEGGVPITYDGFNASYIRTLRKIEVSDPSKPASASMPNLHFKHPAAAIKFSAVKVEDEENTEHQQIYVRNVTLKNVPSKATLCIADRVNQENEGKLVEAVSVVERLNLSPDSPMNTELTTETSELGYMFVMPGYETIDCYITLSVNGIQQELEFSIDPEKMGATTDGFEAGYKYGIKITVHEAPEIYITASVEGYRDAFQGEGGSSDDGDVVIE